MSVLQDASSAQPFFLKSATGQRFCLFHPPAGDCRGTVLYVHPFAEELNRSRRMAAMQARALAALGYGVLQIDLYGCGDSSGDFGDARWQLWKEDLEAGAAWLRQRLDGPLVLWGLRLGALLALDHARSATHPPAAMLLWQPVLNGSAYLTQFLRLRATNALLNDAVASSGTAGLRAELDAGQTIEIAGYDLAPELARALDGLDPLEAMMPACPVHWFEALGSSGQSLSAGAARVSADWQARGIELQVHALQCPPFWITSEITECPAWIEATSAAVQEDMHAV
jgi:exosortase A-associated hydrolase 2